MHFPSATYLVPYDNPVLSNTTVERFFDSSYSAPCSCLLNSVQVDGFAAPVLDDANRKLGWRGKLTENARSAMLPAGPVRGGLQKKP